MVCATVLASVRYAKSGSLAGLLLAMFMIQVLTSPIQQTENPGVYFFRAAQYYSDFVAQMRALSTLDAADQVEVLPMLYEGQPRVRKMASLSEPVSGDSDDPALLLVCYSVWFA